MDYDKKIDFSRAARSAAIFRSPYDGACAGNVFLSKNNRSRAADLGSFAAAHKQFYDRFTREFTTDWVRMGQSYRPSSLLRPAASKAPTPTLASRPPNPSVDAASQTPAKQTFWAKTWAQMCRVPALLGTAVGFVIDAIVVSAALVLLFPVALFHAFKKTPKYTGLHLEQNNPAVRADLEKEYNAAVARGVQRMQATGANAASAQLELDLHRQTMYIRTSPDGDKVALTKDYLAAIPRIAALCVDETGKIDKAWMWAVTDMSAQGLLNGAYAQLVRHQTIRYDGYPCIPNLNGDSSITLSRQSSSTVAVQAQVLFPDGLQVFDMTSKNRPIKDPTPRRLDVEVLVHRNRNADALPRVQVTQVRFTAY